ncbi:MAG: hypothetical protein EBR28_09340 [Planctomycetia bacterium]|nr:hypothetical protein [Planctomycetia bacterium]
MTVRISPRGAGRYRKRNAVRGGGAPAGWSAVAAAGSTAPIPIDRLGIMFRHDHVAVRCCWGAT